VVGALPKELTGSIGALVERSIFLSNLSLSLSEWYKLAGILAVLGALFSSQAGYSPVPAGDSVFCIYRIEREYSAEYADRISLIVLSPARYTCLIPVCCAMVSAVTWRSLAQVFGSFGAVSSL
jgi:hypothetical protein